MKGTNERKTGWEVLYDFLTEIFAMLIPGAYFISFFIFLILIYVCCVKGNADAGGAVMTGKISSIFGLLIAAGTYCFGAFFHRREIKVVDEASARHIYNKSKHESGHSYAYANALSADYLRRFAYILHYHILLYIWGIKDPSDKTIVDNCFKDRENEGKNLIVAMNKAIEQEIMKVVKTIEINKDEDPQVLDIIDWFRSGEMSEKGLINEFRPEEKENIGGTAADEDNGNLQESTSSEERKRVFSKGDLVSILRERLMAEKNDVYIIERKDARAYKHFLKRLNDACHGTLKERLEHCLWRVVKNKELEKTVSGHHDKTEKEFFKKLKKALNQFFPPELREFKGIVFPEISPEKDNEEGSKLLKKFRAITKGKTGEKDPPKIEDRKGSCKQLSAGLKDVLKEILKEDLKKDAENSGESGKSDELSQIEHAVRRIERLIDDDINGRVEWPYTRMYQYCFDRGLEFADLVDWGDGAAVQDDFVFVIDTLGLTTGARISDEYKRSKIRVNTDKIEIGVCAPSLGRILEKNEAHIRFNNSMWYAKELLKVPLYVAVSVFAVLIILSQVLQNIAYFSSNLMLWVYLLLLSLAYLFAGIYINKSVLEIMHYQRVRELTMFLEAKHLYNNQKAKQETEEKPVTA